MEIIFITGIGTDIGKTVAASILVEALNADYWKPIQAGIENSTDAKQIESLSNPSTVIHPEVYRLNTPASPHIAARIDNTVISIDTIVQNLPTTNKKYLIVEGAGGIMVPINENQFVYDLIKALNAKVILVSKNYLGSINHSLLTASFCKTHNIPVIGWVFNQQYLNYEEDIVRWTGIPGLHSIPHSNSINKEFIQTEAALFRKNNPSFYE